MIQAYDRKPKKTADAVNMVSTSVRGMGTAAPMTTHMAHLPFSILPDSTLHTVEYSITRSYQEHAKTPFLLIRRRRDARGLPY